MPTFEPAVVLAGQLLLAGRFAEAEHICRAILARNPRHAAALALLAKAPVATAVARDLADLAAR